MNRILIILFFLVLGSNAYILFDKQKKEEKFSKLLYLEKVNSINFKSKTKDYNKYIKALYLINVPKDRKPKLISYFQKNQILNSPKVVFFYKKKACGSCIKENLLNLIKLGKVIGDENIIVVNNKNSKDMVEEYDSPFKFLTIDTFYLEVEKLEEPMLFVIDEALHVDLLYMPQLYPEFKEHYFIKIIPQYFENL